MFCLSKDGRILLEALHRQLSLDAGFSQTQPNLQDRILCDQAILMFAPSTAMTFIADNSIRGITQKKPSLLDCPNIDLQQYLEAYLYITEQFVTRDYSRIELLKMASMMAQYDPQVIKKIGDRCKSLNHFIIPYLVSAVDQEASEVIEELRRDARLEEKVAETPRLELPDVRPTNLTERLEELAHDHMIDDALRGKI
jgi:hypothetical protein